MIDPNWAREVSDRVRAVDGAARSLARETGRLRDAMQKLLDTRPSVVDSSGEQYAAERRTPDPDQPPS